ncbi:hypothetical protein CSC62_07535 [Pseudoxanthomonas jiangsuensis]|uniref:hypothetical protein n=1 Tax=Pseudoxanthomonas jiangsuensis TaxID=619688 RepID=UPI0013915100|nr:hypothetical protein [Pseudoxanthomonas jiangsuensis]KAF1697988.1 hypothetical protein CSC62_07535 [Pseudoxanthomonas jiangsuensis]
MPGILRLLIAAGLVLALSGASCQHKPDDPDPGVAVRPEPVIVERRVYVPVPSSLTRREPIAEGPIAMCFDVAAQRRAALERANAKLQQVEAIQGTEVKP